ncbi:Microtubule-nucleating Tub4p (gamma-tubulin) complex component, variant 2 [Entomophthora muscae]|uniref:Microtubule-nucleating Tub4p (Gamma-tubulin) complex component, variant 2 n=1 Tax=Entomophthora muscae TaxID=34485 RepID=A0ACC2U9Q2_9FUNG|nr:Microtubule-nucleating Tub4p (gamma-tubulin) complex component, variant 2 [Entomophthora muscae]
MDRTRLNKHVRYNRSRASTEETLTSSTEPVPDLIDGLDFHIMTLLRSMGWDFPSNAEIKSMRSSQLESALTPEQHDIYDYCKNILSSKVYGTTIMDSNHITERVLKRVDKSSRGTNGVIKAQHLIKRISERKLISKPWYVIKFLLCMSSSVKEKATPGNKHTIMQLASNSQAGINLPTHAHLTPAGEGLLQIEPNRQHLPSPVATHARKRANGTVSDVIPESTLVLDLIFIFQGVDGRYIKFDPLTNEPLFAPGVKMTRTVATMVYKLFELGFLYRRLVAYNEAEGQFGLVEQSFRTYLVCALSDYYRLLAALDGRQDLTFRRLLVWTYEPLRKMRMFSNLIDAVQGHRGGGLLSVLHSFTQHGDPAVQELTASILQVVSIPYHVMVKHWLYEGELWDPHQEFFVVCNLQVSDEEMWSKRYSLRQEMIPAFLESNLATKIFKTGKSLNFIRHACRCPNYQWASMPDGNKPIEATTIEEGYSATSLALQDQLFNNFRLVDHLSALRRYLLLGQGDFIQHLIDHLIGDLVKPAGTLHRHNLYAILEVAIRTSNAQHEDPELRKRLDVRIKEFAPSDKGWDAFSLDYHADAPINTVIHTPAMFQYYNLFDFLWRLKRVDYTLTKTWKSHMVASRSFNKFSILRHDLLKCNAVTAEMIHFIYQYQYYLLFEVLECSWERLLKLLGRRELDLDGIIDAHFKYLVKLASKGLLNFEGSDMTARLLATLDRIIQYQAVHEELIDYGLAQLAEHQEADADSSFLRLLENRTTEPIESIRERLDSIYSAFQDNLGVLLNSLSVRSEKEARSLSFRLNYNDIYSASLYSGNLH